MQRIVITGMGCISPLGHDVQTTWKAALAGTSGMGPITLFDAREHETRFAAEVKAFDPVAAKYVDAVEQLARVVDGL